MESVSAPSVRPEGNPSIAPFALASASNEEIIIIDVIGF